ncbi:MAG: hypothetical protein Q8P45_01970 [Candidatus Harrisonbacteria bacterium]|nr:hypothetical protein [Candidatus Harrisonbacteria bacterium]
MNTLEEKKIGALLEEQKWEEAKRLLSTYLDSDLSLEEKGAAYVAFVSTYLKMVNQINEQYELILENMLTDLKGDRQEILALDEKMQLADLDTAIDKLS